MQKKNNLPTNCRNSFTRVHFCQLVSGRYIKRQTTWQPVKIPFSEGVHFCWAAWSSGGPGTSRVNKLDVRLSSWSGRGWGRARNIAPSSSCPRPPWGRHSAWGGPGRLWLGTATGLGWYSQRWGDTNRYSIVFHPIKHDVPSWRIFLNFSIDISVSSLKMNACTTKRSTIICFIIYLRQYPT